MGFQDNSGDIILDMVLTDYGRQKLAKGQGLGVRQFALGDEEINYRLFDKTAATYQQDLTILQTPVLEAFTNNASSLKSRLATYTNENLFYLPIMKLNTLFPFYKLHATNTFLICVDKNTENNNQQTSANATTALGVDGDGGSVDGVLWGATPQDNMNMIRIDNGLDNEATLNDMSFTDQSRDENFIIKIDGRLGKLASGQGALIDVAATDDDGIDTYLLAAGTNNNFVYKPAEEQFGSTSAIAGFKHNSLQFKIQTTSNLQSSNYYFDLLGNTGLSLDNASGTTTTVKYIDSLIHIEGVTTGYSLSIPIRYIKI